MSLVSTEGLVLFGPGSEWFWSMAQFVVVAVTLVGIYVQFRLARAANAFAQASALREAWEGERLVRSRLAILEALRDGGPTADLSALAPPVGNFWDGVGALVRAGHVDLPVIGDSLGNSCLTLWAMIEPEVRRVQATEGSYIWSNFVWLVGALQQLNQRRGVTDIANGTATVMSRLPSMIAGHRATLDALAATRTVTLAVPTSTGTQPTFPSAPSVADLVSPNPSRTDA